MRGDAGDDSLDQRGLVVRSKLQPPVERARVQRPRLIDRCVVPHRKLTVICAPAGWGKSTLLADWWSATRTSHAFAWMVIDGFDNDPVRFWAHVIEALRTVDPNVGARVQSRLNAPRVDLLVDVLPGLVNDLVDLESSVVLVLDDYHLITSADIHTAVAFFLDHLPPNVQIAVTTRTQPPFPLARWRARGDLVDIDLGDLAFRVDEARELLNELHRLDLDDDAAGRVNDATEGWAAALHLSALTLRAAPSVESLVSEVTRSNRHIEDYLAHEVLAELDRDTSTFLLQTSILGDLCASLCDEVTDRTDSERILAALESANLFLVPLDQRREWYRYHQLFAGFLRQQLTARDRDADREMVASLHRRAAAWYWRLGRTDEAISHTLNAGDVSAAADLIVDRWPETRASARLETLLGWIDLLPTDFVDDDPRLCLIRASTLQELGRIDESERWLDRAAVLASADAPAVASLPLQPGIIASRAVNAYYRGDADAILAVARTSSGDSTPPDYWNSVLQTTIGAARLLRGEFDDAIATLESAVSVGARSGHTLALIHALGWQAIASMERSQAIHAASAVAQAERLVAANPGLEVYYGAAMLAMARGQALELDGELHRADEELKRAMHLAAQGAAMIELAYAATVRARIAARLGDSAVGVDHLRRARDAARTLRGCPMLTTRIESVARLLAGRPDDRSYVEQISDRERAVLRLLPSNLTQREIADELDISFNTVKTHTRNIFRKLAVDTRTAAITRARELGLL